MKHFIIVIFTLISHLSPAQGTWMAIPGAPFAGRIDDITFINDSTGFISVHDSIYRTDDVGNTWNFLARIDSSNNSNYARSIEFVNDTLGFVGAILGFNFGGMYRTIDGGLSWTKLLNMQMTGVDGICGIDSDDAGLLIAVGTYAGPGKFYKTLDYGNTWITQDLSGYASGLVDCKILDANTYLISGMADSANQYKATILKTTDGGTTWQRVFLASGPQLSYVWKLFIRPNGKGLASLQWGPNAVATTDNFGDSWTERTVSMTFNDYGGVAMLNDTLGWVADQYSTVMWETQDGGFTWDQSNSMNSGNRMIITGNNDILASGNTIYRYNFPTGLIAELLPEAMVHELKIYPNPVGEVLSINAIAHVQTYGHLDILNSEGKLVANCFTGIFKTGENIVKMNVSNLSEGIYTLVWRNNERFISEKLSVVRRK